MLEEGFMDQESLITGVDKSRVFLQTGSEANFLRHFWEKKTVPPPNLKTFLWQMHQNLDNI